MEDEGTRAPRAAGKLVEDCLSWTPGLSFSYRTVVRPTYKVMYKTVTAREWRCCPGHSGVTCEEGRKAWDLGPFVKCHSDDAFCPLMATAGL